MFHFYVDSQDYDEDAWHTLVHVCQRWRCLVFASPCRLRLQLFCTNRRPVKKMLDIWPTLPIVISAGRTESQWLGMADVVVALKQHDRVCKITIDDIPNLLLKKFGTMKKPFPALSYLHLSSGDEGGPVLPGSFLGGSAPRLSIIDLERIPFPGISKLLLSTHDLVYLRLWRIPSSGYISPEALVSSLSALTRLQELVFGFLSPRSRAVRESRHPPPLRRIVLPALTWLQFCGDSEYLEDIVSRIDAPLLDSININFFNQLLFDTPRLRHFINRTEGFRAPRQANVVFEDNYVEVTLHRPNKAENDIMLYLHISCKPSDWQLSSLAQLYNSAFGAFSPLPALQRLEINDNRQHWQDDIENTQWLEVLHLFPSVRDLVLHGELVRLVAPALKELTGEPESITEMLPALQGLFLEVPQPSEPVKKVIRKFIFSRQLSGFPIAVHHRNSWDEDYVCWEDAHP